MTRASQPPGDGLSILLIALGGVGDAVLCSSMTAMIKRDLPQSRLAVLAWDNGGERVLQRLHEIDRLVLYPSATRLAAWKQVQFARGLRRHEFDVAVAYYSDFDYRIGAMAWLAGIRRRIGPAARRHGFTFTDPIPMRPGRHILELNLDLLRPLGVQDPVIKPRLPLTPEELASGVRFLRETAPPGREVIGISPGCGELRKGWLYRRWGQSRYAELSNALVRRRRAFLLYFGAPHERTYADAIAGEADLRPDDYVNLAGQVSLFEFASLARSCDVMICNDSGALNIVSAVDARVLAIFGATDPSHAGPFSRESRTLYVRQPCSPCLDVYRYDSTGCPPQYCMQAISPATVFEAASAMLEQARV